MSKSRRTEALDAFIDECGTKCTLTGWNAFVEELAVPPDMFPALVTNRPELLKAAKPRAMSAEEVAVLYKLIAGLIETNSALREHAEMLAQSVDSWADAFKQLRSVGNKIQRFANFEPVSEREFENAE